MRVEPIVQEYMTQQPQSIESRENVITARKIMSSFGIRHLPVTTDGVVVGILSERELNLAMGMESLDHEQLLVIDVCSEKPYIAYPETPLREVVTVMAREHLGSAIIMENAKLTGIFTTVDACRVLGNILAENYTEANSREIKQFRQNRVL